MRRVQAKVKGRRVKIPEPETLEELRDLCATEEDFFAAAVHGWRQKLLSSGWKLAERKPRLSNKEIEERLSEYVYSSFKREPRS